MNKKLCCSYNAKSGKCKFPTGKCIFKNSNLICRCNGLPEKADVTKNKKDFVIPERGRINL